MQNTLSPRELAAAVGVSESSLKRWADEGRVKVARTAGGHRRIELAEAVRFIRQSGLPIIDPRPLGLADLSNIPKDETGRTTNVDHALVEAILAGQAVRARGLAISMYLGGSSIAEICDGPIARAMHAAGDLWKHSDEGIFIEHRATDICLQALHQLRGILTPPDETALVAIGGSPNSDPYMLPTLMVATVLAAAGWRDENLGPEVPFELFAQSAIKGNASLVWIALSVEHKNSAAPTKVLELSAELKKHNISLVLGGRAAPPRSAVPDDHIQLLTSMSELSAFARGLQASRSPNSPLPAT